MSIFDSCQCTPRSGLCLLADTSFSVLSDGALQTASSALLPVLPGTLPSRNMSRLLSTSMYVSQRGEQTGQENVTTKEVALANLRYCWNDSRQAKIFQLVNVWRMWNEVSVWTSTRELS